MFDGCPRAKGEAHQIYWWGNWALNCSPARKPVTESSGVNVLPNGELLCRWPHIQLLHSVTGSLAVSFFIVWSQKSSTLSPWGDSGLFLSSFLFSEP